MSELGRIVESQFDVREGFYKIDVPVLTIGGDGDQWIPFQVQEEIWQNMKANQTNKSKLVKLNNCGHFSFYECPTKLKSPVVHNKTEFIKVQATELLF